MRLAAAACALAFAPVTGGAASAFRLTGLERLYFDARATPGRSVEAPPEIAAMLPDVLTKAAHEADEDVAVRDLPLAAGGRTLVLRELLDARHPRVVETWWAVYERGRRGDVWRFAPASGLADGKALVNLRVEDVTAGADGRVVVRLAGRVARPQGAWSIVGKVLTLAPSPGGLAVAHLRNAFGFFRSYDDGGAPPSLAVASEREDTDGFEERRLDPAPEAVLTRCGYAEEADGALSWDALDRVAACVADAPGHATARRKLDTPSFVERGGRAR